MTSEQQLGNLSEDYVTQILGARREHGALKGEDESDSYMVSFGDPAHPAWIRVWPAGGGIALESDWGRLEVEGISQVGPRRGQLWLISSQEHEQIEVDVSPTGSWSARRELSSERQSQAQAETAETERVTLRGSVGRGLRFRETPQRKQLVGSFSLAVHPDENTTNWYTVVVFGQWAKRLQDKPLTVGQEVEVVGYLHERERTTRDGSTHHEEQIYAAAVRTSLDDTSRKRSS